MVRVGGAGGLLVSWLAAFLLAWPSEDASRDTSRTFWPTPTSTGEFCAVWAPGEQVGDGDLGARRAG